MLIKIKELSGYKIAASNSEIGKVDDFYFDDQDWIIRYLVVNTGNWLTGRRVLISPSSFAHLDIQDKKFHLNLTKLQIEKSPDISSDKPVSRQNELELANYFQWPVYWMPGGMAMTNAMQIVTPPEGQKPDDLAPTAEASHGNDPHLRSANEIRGYKIQASNGDIGHVIDLLVEDSQWVWRYLLIDTRDWLGGKKAIIASDWIAAIDWESEFIRVDLTREDIAHSPEYDPTKPIGREYETALYGHYGRSRQW